MNNFIITQNQLNHLLEIVGRLPASQTSSAWTTLVSIHNNQKIEQHSEASDETDTNIPSTLENNEPEKKTKDKK